MAAPVAAARVTPTGKRLDDGLSTKVAFTADPDIAFWEKTVKPPGIDGGDAIDTSTMHNVAWRSRGPRKLKTLQDVTIKAAYDPALYTQILALINAPGVVTVHFPNLSSLAFYGFLRSFEPDEAKESDQPEATITVTPTNIDPATGTEEAPVFTAPPP